MSERLAALLRLPPHQRHRQLLAALPRTDHDVLREHHRFIREDDAPPTSYEERLASKYYAKLFKEYAIADLRHYKEQRIGLRWRTAEEVVGGKGQFACAAKGCDAVDGLVSYEVNFAYEEAGEQKQALVKLRVCPRCADKLNYKRKTALRRAEAPPDAERERKRRRASAGGDRDADEPAGGADEQAGAGGDAADAAAAAPPTEAEHWGAPAPKAEERSREDEFDLYLSGMFA